MTDDVVVWLRGVHETAEQMAKDRKRIKSLEAALEEIMELVEDNLDSEFDGGRAVNPNTELKVYTAANNALEGR